LTEDDNEFHCDSIAIAAALTAGAFATVTGSAAGRAGAMPVPLIRSAETDCIDTDQVFRISASLIAARARGKTVRLRHDRSNSRAFGMDTTPQTRELTAIKRPCTDLAPNAPREEIRFH
jgi:hypothetical protein